MNTIMIQPKNKAQIDTLIALAASWQIKFDFFDFEKFENNRLSDFFINRENKELMSESEANDFLNKLG